MVAPLVGIAIGAAARLAAKKLAGKTAKKVTQSTTSRARSNSAAAAKAVAPKNPSNTASKIKMAKTADARRKFDAASQKRILDNQAKKSVKVLPRKTAPKTDLSSRGAKPTRLERSERAAELSFKKAEGRYEGEYLTRMTGLKGPKGVTSQSTRGQGTRSLRKEAAINKEARAKIVKINSQRNLKAK